MSRIPITYQAVDNNWLLCVFLVRIGVCSRKFLREVISHLIFTLCFQISNAYFDINEAFSHFIIQSLRRHLQGIPRTASSTVRFSCSIFYRHWDTNDLTVYKTLIAGSKTNSKVLLWRQSRPPWSRISCWVIVLLLSFKSVENTLRIYQYLEMPSLFPSENFKPKFSLVELSSVCLRSVSWYCFILGAPALSNFEGVIPPIYFDHRWKS